MFENLVSIVANNTVNLDKTNEVNQDARDSSYEQLKMVQSSYLNTGMISMTSEDFIRSNTIFIEKNIVDSARRDAYRESIFYDQYVNMKDVLSNRDIFSFTPLVLLNGLLITDYDIKTLLSGGFELVIGAEYSHMFVDVVGIDIIFLDETRDDVLMTNIPTLDLYGYRLPLTNVNNTYVVGTPIILFAETKEDPNLLTPITGSIGLNSDVLTLNVDIPSGTVPSDRDFKILIISSPVLKSGMSTQPYERARDGLLSVVCVINDENNKPYEMPISELDFFVMRYDAENKNRRYITNYQVECHYPNIYEFTSPDFTIYDNIYVSYTYKDIPVSKTYPNITKYLYRYYGELLTKYGYEVTDLYDIITNIIYEFSPAPQQPFPLSVQELEFFYKVYDYQAPTYEYDIQDFLNEGLEQVFFYKVGKLYDFAIYNKNIVEDYALDVYPNNKISSVFTRNIDLQTRLRRDNRQETSDPFKVVEFDEDMYVFTIDNGSYMSLDIRVYVDNNLIVDTYSFIDLYSEYLYIPARYITSDSYIEIEKFEKYVNDTSYIFTSLDEYISITYDIEDIYPTIFDFFAIMDDGGTRLSFDDFRIYSLMERDVYNMAIPELAEIGDKIIYDDKTHEAFIDMTSVLSNINNEDPTNIIPKYMFLNKLRIYCLNEDLIDTPVNFVINKVPFIYQKNPESVNIPSISVYNTSMPWRNDPTYIRCFINGALIELNYTIEEISPINIIIHINNLIAPGEPYAIDISPYSYRLEKHISQVPENFIVDTSDLEFPFNLEYYDVYLNNKKMGMNNITAITPNKVKLYNVFSRNNLKFYRKDRDVLPMGPYVGDTLLDELLETDFITADDVEKLTNEIIKDKYPDIIINKGMDTETINPDTRPQVDEDTLEFYKFHVDVILPIGVVQPDVVELDADIIRDLYRPVYDKYVDLENKVIITSANDNPTTKNVLLIGKDI